jgi:hypothetical protein
MTKYFKSRFCREDIQTDALSTKKFARVITQAEKHFLCIWYRIFSIIQCINSQTTSMKNNCKVRNYMLQQPKGGTSYE